jgi:hypothetical protein
MFYSDDSFVLLNSVHGLNKGFYKLYFFLFIKYS